VLLLLLVVSLLGSHVSRVSAHANLDTSDPAKDARLTQAPSTMTLRFTQGLKPEGSWVQVAGDDGVNRVTEFSFDPSDKKVMRAEVEPLHAGVYTVKYQSLSAGDDDYHDGSYQFTVLNPDGSNPGAEAASSQPSGEDDDGGSVTTIVAVVAAVILVGGALVFALRYKRSPT